MINPAIALPLGLMRRPILENISPNNHKFPIKTGKISVKNRLLSFNEFMMYPSKENNMNDIRTNTKSGCSNAIILYLSLFIIV